MTPQPRAPIVDELKTRAQTLGFDAFGITRADSRPDLPEKLDNALAHGWHAGMGWLETTATRRAAPTALWPEARSVIALGMNYDPRENPMNRLADWGLGNISVYAQSKDYHDVIKGRLKEIAGLLARRLQADVKVFVDTAPLMEKPLAEAAGIGWQGKHSVLVSRAHGSWLFLGMILTDAELPADAPEPDHCGTCTRCLDICPTDAFPAPYRLDARKCLAYYSVEHEGQIPLAYRAPMGNRIFGCDDCLAVCPWNKFASAARTDKLVADAKLAGLRIADLLELDDSAFRKLFAGTPVKRLGVARFLRNVLAAAGNSGDAALLPKIEQLLDHESPLVRGMAVWATKRLAQEETRARLAALHRARETDPEVLAEWHGVNADVE